MPSSDHQHLVHANGHVLCSTQSIVPATSGHGDDQLARLTVDDYTYILCRAFLPVCVHESHGFHFDDGVLKSCGVSISGAVHIKAAFWKTRGTGSGSVRIHLCDRYVVNNFE